MLSVHGSQDLALSTARLWRRRAGGARNREGGNFDGFARKQSDSQSDPRKLFETFARLCGRTASRLMFRTE